jgi:aspartokinase-like uncharacterized kinase
MSTALTIVKLGGSLYDLPDLQGRLHHWLAERADDKVTLVPGGGATANVVRRFDAIHGLGEEKAHWLALRALALNAMFLAALMPGTPVVGHPCQAVPGVSILDPFAFAASDEGQNPTCCLPQSWETTSDAIAARAAVVGGAARLILLKSVTIPQGIDWKTAADLGFVDMVFAELIRQAPGVAVEAVNFRM